MGGLLFSVPILAAVLVFAWRAHRRRQQARAHRAELSQRRGYSPEHPLPVASFNDLDDFVALARCPCGGLLDRVGEGSRPGMRVARCVCLTCEEEVDLFFDLSPLRH